MGAPLNEKPFISLTMTQALSRVTIQIYNFETLVESLSQIKFRQIVTNVDWWQICALPVRLYQQIHGSP